jgi:hypothetical protein
MKLYGIYEQVVGVPASSLSRLRGPWPENVEDPWRQWENTRRTLLAGNVPFTFVQVARHLDSGWGVLRSRQLLLFAASYQRETETNLEEDTRTRAQVRALVYVSPQSVSFDSCFCSYTVSSANGKGKKWAREKTLWKVKGNATQF